MEGFEGAEAVGGIDLSWEVRGASKGTSGNLPAIGVGSAVRTRSTAENASAQSTLREATGAASGSAADDVEGDLLDLAISALDAGEVVLDDLLPALAEVLAERLLHALVDLLVGHAALGGVGGELEEGAEQDDALHAHLEVGDGSDLAGDLDHVGEVDAEVLGPDRASIVVGDPHPDLARVGVGR